MKNLQEFILENLQDLKNLIKDKLDSLDEETLKRIIKIINNVDFNKEQFDNQLNKLGITSSVNDLYRLIDSFKESESTAIIKAIINDDYKFTVNDFINGHNIYDLIIAKNKDISKEALEEIALTSPHQGVNKGEFEILCQLFMRDITPNNIGRNDINTTYDNGTEFEFKSSGARICGNGTLNSPKEVYRHFHDLLSEFLNADNIKELQNDQSSLIRLPISDEELNKIANDQDFYDDVVNNMDNYDFLNKIDVFENYFEKLLNHNISADVIISMLCESLLYQVTLKNNVKKDNVFNKSVLNEFIEFTKKYSPFENNKPNARQFRKIILVFHIYFYYMHHHFKYIVIFSKKNLRHKENGKNVKTNPDGNYIMLGDKDNKTFKSFENIYNQIGNKIKPIAGLTKGNAQEYASCIELKTSSIIK